MKTTVTIGWTLLNTEDPTREYVSFSDGYREGAPQHEVTFEIETYGVTGRHVAESAFIATNAPEVGPETLAGHILAKISESGYTGRVDRKGYAGHYSLSVGDTVTVDGAKYACEPFGWGLRA